MEVKDEKRLLSKYPWFRPTGQRLWIQRVFGRLDYRIKTLFKLQSYSGSYPFEMFGLEVGPGWTKLLFDLCAEIDVELRKDPELLREFFVTQVKEKFGGLRFYTSFSNDAVMNIISKYEQKSYEVCEQCGEPGKPNKQGWITTLCFKCKQVRDLEHCHAQKTKKE